MNPITAAVLAVLLYVHAVFVIALIRRNNGLADLAWGGGFVVISLAVGAATGWRSPRVVLLAVLFGLWGSRLAAHILTRNRGRGGEDFRYRQWRESWGRWFVLRSYLQVFLLQGALMVLVGTPILVVGLRSGGRLGVLDFAGSAVWLSGFLCEAVADWQLLRFKRDPENRGAIMTTGLWRLSRHPNYFGEALLWWGPFLIALSAPYGVWAVVSPLTIGFLLLRVSGIPMLEKKYEGRADFARYKASTSAFVPWPPKRSTSNGNRTDAG